MVEPGIVEASVVAGTAVGPALGSRLWAGVGTAGQAFLLAGPPLGRSRRLLKRRSENICTRICHLINTKLIVNLLFYYIKFAKRATEKPHTCIKCICNDFFTHTQKPAN